MGFRKGRVVDVYGLRWYKCAGCGQWIREDELVTSNSHARAGPDENGNQVAVQCGPVSTYSLRMAELVCLLQGEG